MAAVATFSPATGLVAKPLGRENCSVTWRTTSLCPFKRIVGHAVNARGSHSSIFEPARIPLPRNHFWDAQQKSAYEGVAAVSVALDGNGRQLAEHVVRENGGQSLPSNQSLVLGSPVKQCIECDHVKPMVDFGAYKAAPDGRYNVCRACLAASRVKHEKREPHHLAMTVEEAWERSKACTSCGLVKELRDYVRTERMKDGIANWCRACKSKEAAERNNAPTDAPTRCSSCREVKAASDFYPDKGQKSGLYGYCKTCGRLQVNGFQTRIKDRPKVPIIEKKCKQCGMLKQPCDFNKDRLLADGLNPKCRLCVKKARLERASSIMNRR